MKKQFLLLLILISCAVSLVAQEYSYISDRKFPIQELMVGYDFKPYKLEIPNERETELDPGSYSFGVTLHNLYVDGEGIQGVYTINHITADEYGYKINTVNARDARIQGHLKVILNPQEQVEALIFRKSKQDPEIIFHLPVLSDAQAQKEAQYFTDLHEVEVEATLDSIYGTTLYPFIKIFAEAGVQQRQVINDSLRVSFIETIEIERKEIKSKKKKKKPVRALEEFAGAEVTADTIIEPAFKEKIIVKRYLEIYGKVVYKDGSSRYEAERYEIKKLSEGEDEAAGIDEERFRIEIENTKKVPIFLYLTGDRKVSSLEVGDMIYLMRGW